MARCHKVRANARLGYTVFRVCAWTKGWHKWYPCQITWGPYFFGKLIFDGPITEPIIEFIYLKGYVLYRRPLLCPRVCHLVALVRMFSAVEVPMVEFVRKSEIEIQKK